MKLSLNFEKLLKNTVMEDLDWFMDEFNTLFENKSDFTSYEINLANQLLGLLKKDFSCLSLEPNLQELLTQTLDKIGNRFPEFF